MKRLLFLIFFLSAIAYGQTNPMADEVRVQGLKDTLETRIDSVISAIGTIEGSTDTRLDSLIAALNAVESAADTRIDSILANSLPELDTRIDSILTPLAAVEDSVLNKYTKSDTRIVIADSLAEMRDSVANRYTKAEIDGMGLGSGSVTSVAKGIGIVAGDPITTTGTIDVDTSVIANKTFVANQYSPIDTTKNLRITTNALTDSVQNKYTKSDTRAVIYDSVAVQRDSVGIHRIELDALMDSVKSHYSQAIIDILLDLKLDITDSSYLVPYTYLTAALAYYSPIAGSSSITTLGTITTGTWNATSIDTAKTNALSYLWEGYGMTLSARGKGFQLDADTTDDLVSKNYGDNQYQEKGTYVNTVTASGDIESTGGTEPNISLGTGKVAPSAGDTTIWNAKLSASQVYPLTYAAKQAGSKINTNHLYVTTDDSIDVSSEGSGVTAEQISDTADVLRAEFNEYYEGAFTGTNYADTLTGTFNTYDRWLVNPIAVTDADTMSNPLLPFPKKDTLIVIRKSDGCKSGLVYGAQRKLGALSPVTSVDAVAISSDTITVTWTAPVTSSASTARTVDSVAVSWSKSGHRTDLTDAGDSVHYYVKTILADTISSLETSTLYYVDLFAMTYSDELSAYAGDTCTTEDSGERDNYMLDSLHVFLAFDETEDGSNASDSSGHDATFTNNNNASYETGLIGNCVRLDSVKGSYLSRANDYYTQFGDRNYTIAVWVMAKNIYDGAKYIMYKYAALRLYRDAFNDEDFRVYNGTSTAAGTVTSGETLADTTTWHLFVIKHNTDVDSIYISYDGGAFAQAATSQAPGYDVDQALKLGYSSTAAWIGLLDNFAVWGRCLTWAEAAWYYKNGAGRYFSELE